MLQIFWGVGANTDVVSTACDCCPWDVRELRDEVVQKDIEKKWTKDSSLWSPKTKALGCAAGTLKEDIG